MTKYRKRPIVVEARGPITEPETIITWEGTMTASVGDYIITGTQGELYPCKPDVFVDVYEPVGKPTPELAKLWLAVLSPDVEVVASVALDQPGADGVHSCHAACPCQQEAQGCI